MISRDKGVIIRQIKIGNNFKTIVSEVENYILSHKEGVKTVKNEIYKIPKYESTHKKNISNI